MSIPLLKGVVGILKTLTVRKLAKKSGLTPQNAAKPSTLMGTSAVVAAYAVENPHLYFESLGLGAEGDVFVRVAMALVGLYAIFSEKK